MTKDDVFDISSNTPVLLKDGRIGLLLIYPIGKGDREGLCGIQIPSENYHRWVHHDKLMHKDGGIVETE